MAEDTSRGRILIIDDEEATRYVFRRILGRAGFLTLEAATGAAGLELAMSLPDLVICDVNLPDMLGYDVCRRLRANPLTVSIPILQVSAAFVSDESMVQALEGGADSYLTQPVEPMVLLAQVNALLRLRRAEALSNLSARQWQATFDALSDGLALSDAEGVIVRVNRALLDLLGFVPSDVEGKPVADLFESRFDLRFRNLLRACAGGHSVELPYGTRWFRVRYDLIQSDPHDLSGTVLLVTDITNQRKLQESLKLSERLAATGRLAHIIAHEINNPLEAMSNLLYLSLQEAAGVNPIDSYLQQASTELVRISHITKQVLAFHRESKELVDTRSDELLEGTLSVFRAQMLSRGIELRLKADSSASVHVHPGEIRQVFSNLVANGLDAIAGSGTLCVGCRLGTDQRSGRTGVWFTFSDSGSGIPASVLPRIFEAFYSTKELKGSGIGLWLSEEVVTKHGGRIRLRSRTAGPYRGTLFSVFLPESAGAETYA